MPRRARAPPRPAESDSDRVTQPPATLAPDAAADTRDRRTRRLATVALIAITAVWGSTFFMIRDLVETIPSVDFLAVRFSAAAVIMLVMFWPRVRTLPRRELHAGIVLGLMYGVAQMLQTEGLAHTSASVSGFVTGMYVVFTPLLSAALLRERVSWVTWGAVGLSATGLGVLSLTGLAFGPGETMTLGAALLYAFHILTLGRTSTPANAIALSVVQLAVIAVICTVGAIPGGVTLPQTTGQWVVVAYMVVAASIGSLLVQTWAQAHISAVRAAIVMTFEPVFAAFFAVLAGGESITWRMLVGGGLIVAAMYVIELVPSRKGPPAEALHHEPAA